MKIIYRVILKHRKILILIVILLLIIYLFYDYVILHPYAILVPLFQESKTSLYPHNVFHYPVNLLTHPECTKNYDIVFLVKTGLYNENRRLAIRETWGREDRFNVRTIFIIGALNNFSKAQLIKDHDNFGDILLGEFYDNYDNLSLKCITAIEWARNHCNSAKFYVLVDDDSYVSTKNLLAYLNDTSLYDKTVYHPNMFLNSSHSKLRLLAGEVMRSRAVTRHGKYRVHRDEYAAARYPDYIDGHTVVMSRDVLDELHEAARHVKYFRLDDVYMAFLAMKAHLQLTNIPGITREYLNFWDVWGVRTFTLRKYDSVISSHYMTSGDQLLRIWSLQKQRGNV